MNANEDKKLYIYIGGHPTMNCHNEKRTPKKYDEALYIFKIECAKAIVSLLQNECPEFPNHIAFPNDLTSRYAEMFSTISDEEVSLESKIRANWGFVALDYWVNKQLSNKQKFILKDWGKLADLQFDYYLYLIDDSKEHKAPKEYILKSTYPESNLKEWFARFLNSKRGPFNKNLLNKLKKRFSNVLKEDEQFTTIKNDCWDLASINEPRKLKSDEDIEKLLFTKIKSLKPVLYKSANREDPIIKKSDIIKIALLVLTQGKACTSYDFARFTAKLLPTDIWATIYLPSEEERQKILQVENVKKSTSEIEEGKEIKSFELIVIELFASLKPKTCLVAIARLCTIPPYTLKEIKEWSEKHFPVEYHMKVSNAHYYAGEGDKKIKKALFNAFEPLIHKHSLSFSLSQSSPLGKVLFAKGKEILENPRNFFTNLP